MVEIRFKLTKLRIQHREYKVSTFDERKDAFENKFAHEQNVTFKIEALRNKLLGAWAAELKGLDEDETEQYTYLYFRSSACIQPLVLQR